MAIDNTKKIQEFLNPKGFYVIEVLKRKKDGNKIDDSLYWELVQGSFFKYKIDDICKNHEFKNCRIYVNYSERDISKAILDFKIELDNLLFYKFVKKEPNYINNEITIKHLDLNRLWKSKLMKNQISSKLSHFDIDFKSETIHEWIEERFTINLKLDTINGYHYLIEKNCPLRTYSTKIKGRGIEEKENSLIFVKLIS